MDRIIELWGVRQPGLDASNLEVIGRVLRAAVHIERLREQVLRPMRLSPADFDLLVTMLRVDAGEGVNPSVLSTSCMVTSGAITSRLTRLEGSGLLERRPDPSDRRGVLVRLTPEGERMAHRALDAVFAVHEQVLEPLSERDRDAAAKLLRRLLASAEAL